MSSTSRLRMSIMTAPFSPTLIATEITSPDISGSIRSGADGGCRNPTALEA